MEELVHYLERTPKSQRSAKWKQMIQSLPPPLCSALRPQDWRRVYSMKAINASLAKVRMVGFNEKIVRNKKDLGNSKSLPNEITSSLYRNPCRIYKVV